MPVHSRTYSDLTARMNDKEKRELDSAIDKIVKPHAAKWSEAVAAVKAWRRDGGKGKPPGPNFPDAPGPSGNDVADEVIADEYARVLGNYNGWVGGTQEVPGIYRKEVNVVAPTAPPAPSFE